MFPTGDLKYPHAESPYVPGLYTLYLFCAFQQTAERVSVKLG